MGDLSRRAAWLGVLIYLIVRGKGMQQRAIDDMRARDTMQREYIQEVSGGASSSTADEIARLHELKTSGALTEEEFQSLKAKALNG